MIEEKIVESLAKTPRVMDFKKKLRKKTYESTTPVVIETATIIMEIINDLSEHWSSLNELHNTLKYIGNHIIESDPMLFAVGNIIKRLLHIVHEELDKREANTTNDETENLRRVRRLTSLNNLININTGNLTKFNKLKDSINNILVNISELIEEIENISEAITDKADEHINDNDVILTANNSSQLQEYLIRASLTKKFEIMVTESSPSKSGIQLANNLAAKGITSTVIKDTMIFAMMPKVNKVIVGTKAIMANGGLLSYSGIYNICLSAQLFSIPVIVVGATFKLTPMYPFDHETFNEQLSPDTILKTKTDFDISNIKFNSPAYDYVPPDLITIYVTDHGNQNPDNIYRLFSEFYSQDEYFT